MWFDSFGFQAKASDTVCCFIFRFFPSGSGLENGIISFIGTGILHFVLVISLRPTNTITGYLTFQLGHVLFINIVLLLPSVVSCNL